ncbi:Tripartite ATP-independent transporter, DctM component [Aliiroseovarius crassostreae]|uniref:TRAP transporter large permease subunit n=1 Tax=Aliiroseovarius crassostreae TaxID=154981 RepID=UPI0008E3215C|nr:TRAP transporter large permease subunit [Aliiroseovarius crassostreae]SFU46084.1 Tripartite ATP-independent transporter, DctM component [Aliiroseovarius crassostreae]
MCMSTSWNDEDRDTQVAAVAIDKTVKGIGNVVIDIILAASTGIIGASVVLLGVLSLPSMMEQKYSPSLAAGVVSASGTLGILIPPSIMLVIMADQMALSVGDLFMAAVFPGVIIGGLYLTYIFVIALIKRDVAPVPEGGNPP